MLISSSLYNLRIVGSTGLIKEWTVDLFRLPYQESIFFEINAQLEFYIEVVAPDTSHVMRIMIGNEDIATTPSLDKHIRSEFRSWFYDSFGESRISLKVGIEDSKRELFETIIQIPIAVIATPEVLSDYHEMISQLSSIHQGLAYDYLGKSFSRKTVIFSKSTLFSPLAQIEQIELLFSRLESALDEISIQPSTILEKNIFHRYYRAGDRINHSSLLAICNSQNFIISPRGKVYNIGKIRVQKASISLDTPEHRHIANSIKNFIRVSKGIYSQCLTTSELIKREEAVWLNGGATTAFKQRNLPRAKILEDLANRAKKLTGGFTRLLKRHSFLAEAKEPRTPLGLTPGFKGRPPYFETYKIIRNSLAGRGLLVDDGILTIAVKDLAVLFEYWCFLKTMEWMKANFGSPKPYAIFTLKDNIYLPELQPGQSFTFSINADTSAVLKYEPEFWPLREAKSRGDKYAASLTRNPLRPDITLELNYLEKPAQILILDAKSTSNFYTKKFQGVSDYARQIFEIGSDRQPVRQVFLLHRDRKFRSITNIPDYLEGRAIPRESSIIGAVETAPVVEGETPELLDKVLSNFFEMYVQ